MLYIGCQRYIVIQLRFPYSLFQISSELKKIFLLFFSNWLIKYPWMYSSHTFHIPQIRNLTPIPSLSINCLKNQVYLIRMIVQLSASSPQKVPVFSFFTSLHRNMRKKHTSSSFFLLSFFILFPPYSLNLSSIKFPISLYSINFCFFTFFTWIRSS